jgi:protein-S-isoprenylcysteine O-methyltransferase Ste14
MWRVRSLYLIESLFFLGFGVFVIYQGPGHSRRLIGISMAVVGFGLWMLARVQLGKSFAVRAQPKTLVTTGLYSKFRHPIYLFGGIAYLGLFISWGKLIPLLCFLSIYPVEILRARKEEKVLERAFGGEYRRYKASTWF